MDLDELELAFIYGQAHCAPGRSCDSGETAPHLSSRPDLFAWYNPVEGSAPPSYEMNDDYWDILRSTGLVADPALNVARDQHNLNETWAGFMDDIGVVDGFGFEDPPRA